MAKRRRLTPANPDFLGNSEDKPLPKTGLAPEPMPVEPDVQSPPLEVAPVRSRPRAPIAEVAGQASAAAALQELSEEMTRARDEGRLIQSLALSDIDTGHLVRDRMFADEEELTALIESLRRRGQQTPIEVVDRGQGASPRYGLISGWRRMAALTRLMAEDPKFAQVLTLVRAPSSSSDAYVAMVEENEIRVGLSYYERARVTLKAVEEGVYPDLKTALNTLFGNVSRAKRSKIKSFTQLVEALDGALSYPTQIGERLGLELAKRLENEPGLEARLRDKLVETGPTNEQEERALLALSLTKTSTPKPVRETQVEISYDPGRARLVLTGVDADLYGDLVAWLGKR